MPDCCNHFLAYAISEAAYTKVYSNTFKALWIGRAINTLLPVATIGGEIAKARLITLWGSSGVSASASVLVDKTVQAMAVAVWAFAGTLLLIYLALDNELAIAVMLGISVLAGCLSGFILDDDTLTDNIAHVEALAREIGKLGITWSCNAKANVPHETLKMMVLTRLPKIMNLKQNTRHSFTHVSNGLLKNSQSS